MKKDKINKRKWKSILMATTLLSSTITLSSLSLVACGKVRLPSTEVPETNEPTDPVVPPVNPPPVFQENIDKINHQTIQVKQQQLTTQQFEDLNESNLLQLLNIDSSIAYQDSLTVTDFEKQNDMISFRLMYYMDGAPYYSQTLTFTFNVEKPQPPSYRFNVHSGIKTNIIEDTKAIYYLTLLSSEAIDINNMTVQVKLNNQQVYQAQIVQGVNDTTYNLTINFDRLNEHTTYYITSVDVLINTYTYNAYQDTQQTYRFTTLNIRDSVSTLNLVDKEVIAPDNTVQLSLTLDQLLPSNANKPLRVSFVNKKSTHKVYSDEVILRQNQLNYQFNITLDNQYGIYQLDKVERQDNGAWIPLHIQVNPLPEFVYKNNVSNHPLPYVNKSLSEYGNYYDLQQANHEVKDKLNIQPWTNNSLTPDALIQKHPSYQLYFQHLNNPSKETPTHDVVPINLQHNNSFDIINTSVINDKVQITLKDGSNTNINTLSLMVKSWDHFHPYEKIVVATKQDDKNWTFGLDQLNYPLSQFIITDMIVDNQYHTPFDLFDGYMIKIPHKHQLQLQHFEVYQDHENHLYGTLSFNWDQTLLNNLDNKVFALEFNVQQKRANNMQPFNQFYSAPSIKRIYVPFNQLAKFKLDGLSSGLVYQLSKIEVVNSDSYLSYLEPLIINQPTYQFAFITDWTINDVQLTNQLHEENAPTPITKEWIAAKSSPQTINHEIPYSIENMNTLLDYQINLFNKKQTYNNNNKPVDNQATYTLVKNQVAQSLNFFMPFELLEKTIFDIDAQNHTATITKNLNSIVGLSEDKYEDVVLWLTFELNLNQRRASDFIEYNDIQAKVRVPVNLKNLKQYQTIEDVDFMYDHVQGNKTWQQQQFSKIKSLISFNLSLDDNNQLTLTLKQRNNDINFTNDLWNLNVASQHTAFLGTCNMFVNWVQDANNQTPMLSYQEADRIDELTLQGSATQYNNSYTLKTSGVGEKDKNNKSITDYRYLPEVKPEEAGKRLFKEHQSKGIQNPRLRTFSINERGTGTWNIFAKVNNDPQDYRFYAMINVHVWGDYADKPIGQVVSDGKAMLDHHGNKYLIFDNPSLLAPTVIDYNPIEPQQPIYNPGGTNLTPQGYKMKMVTKENEGIKVKLFQSFFEKYNTVSHDDFRNNEGILETKNSDNDLDMVIVEIDLKCVFDQFANQDLDTMIYEDKPLTEINKGAIRHFLNFVNLPTVEFSNLARYMNSTSNYNFYFNTMPTADVVTNPITAEARRYREYLIGSGSAKFRYGDELWKGDHAKNPWRSNRPLLVLQNRYFDVQNGSSGSGLYDSQGRILGIDVSGHISSSSFWFFIDTQKYSYFGAPEVQYNPNTFYHKANKMSYLYPLQYQDIFK